MTASGYSRPCRAGRHLPCPRDARPIAVRPGVEPHGQLRPSRRQGRCRIDRRGERGVGLLRVRLRHGTIRGGPRREQQHGEQSGSRDRAVAYDTPSPLEALGLLDGRRGIEQVRSHVDRFRALARHHFVEVARDVPEVLERPLVAVPAFGAGGFHAASIVVQVSHDALGSCRCRHVVGTVPTLLRPWGRAW